MDEKILNEFKDMLIEIVYTGRYAEPTSIKAILSDISSDGIKVTTKTYVYYIPKESIKSIRIPLDI